MSNRYIEYKLKQGTFYREKINTLLMTLRNVDQKKKFLHTKQWNQILQLPLGKEKEKERKARVVAAEMTLFFFEKLFTHLASTDDVFVFPMKYFHMKVIPSSKVGYNRVALFPTEQGLVATKCIVWKVDMPKRYVKFLYKKQYQGRTWSEYHPKIDMDKVLFRMNKAKIKRRITAVKTKLSAANGIQ